MQIAPVELFPFWSSFTDGVAHQRGPHSERSEEPLYFVFYFCCCLFYFTPHQLQTCSKPILRALSALTIGRYGLAHST
jgi:hypothetical protein